MFGHEGWSLSSHGLSAQDYTLFGGGVPLRVANAGIAGAMSVSGLDHIKDHELVIEALCWHLGIPRIDSVRSDPQAVGKKERERPHVEH